MKEDIIIFVEIVMSFALYNKKVKDKYEKLIIFVESSRWFYRFYTKPIDKNKNKM